MSAHRHRITLGLLDTPLPVKILLDRLNRELRAAGLREIRKRMLEMDLGRLVGLRLIEQIGQREFTAPVDFAGFRSFYRRMADQDVVPLDPDHELRWLSGNEILALEIARGILCAPKAPGASISGENPLAQAIDGLVGRLGVGSDVRRANASCVSAQTFSKEAYDPAILALVLRATRTGDGLAIMYESLATAGAKLVRIQPIRLALVDNEWFLFAWDGAARKLKTYKISRMASATIVTQLRGAPGMLDSEVDAALLDRFRSTSNQRRVRVSIRIGPIAWPHVRNRTWGYQQRIEELGDGWRRLSFATGGLDGVRWWALGFGADAVAEAPLELVAWLREQTARAAKAYASDKSGSQAH